MAANLTALLAKVDQMSKTVCTFLPGMLIAMYNAQREAGFSNAQAFELTEIYFTRLLDMMGIVEGGRKCPPPSED